MRNPQNLEDLSDEFQSTFSMVKQYKCTVIANMFHISEKDIVKELIKKHFPNYFHIEMVKTGEMGSDPYDVHMIEIREHIE